MKFFLHLAVLLALLWPFSLAAAEETPAVFLELDNREEKPQPTMEEVVNNFIDSAKYFDSKYPGKLIDQDFHEDVARRFPWLSRQEVYDYEGYIRKGTKLYRYFKNLYNHYKESLLVPEEPPLIADNSEYDLLSEEPEYIDADGTVVIQDFKKIISYSNNPREIKAYRAKITEEAGKKGKLKDFEDLGYIFSQLEFKKLPFYNIFYGSPLTGNRGIGEWQKKDDFKIRLITIQTGVNKGQKIEGAIHLIIPPHNFVTAVDGGLYFRPEISFEKSENLKNIEYTLPLPTRLAGSDTDWTVYVEEVAIPFTAEVEDETKKLKLAADVRLNLCRRPYDCESVALSPELTLQPDYLRESSVATYIRMVSGFLRPQPVSELEISDFYLNRSSDGKEVLEISFSLPEKIEAFNLFVGNKSGITLTRPRISISGKRAFVRILPMEGSPSAQNAEFEITAEANNQYVLRTQKTPVEGKMPAPYQRGLSSALLAAAVLGGLLLNFMPCVFPVLSLKLLSLTKFGARNPQAVRRNFALTLAGIWSAFALLAAFLAGLKLLGENIGWGMQFQNPWFITLIFFAVLLFIAQIWGIVEIRIPQCISRQATADESAPLHFLTGTFAVLMATPCTAPYLGTAVGFALTGSTGDIFAIMGGVAFGLSLPYLLMWALPSLSVFIPRPGQWMKNVNRFMVLMLLLTLAWLLHICQTQSGTGFTFRLAVYALLFWLFLWLRKITLEADFKGLPPTVRQKAVKKTAAFFAGLALLTFAGAAIDNHFAAARQLERTEKSHLSSVAADTIERKLKEGKTVLVIVGADWCLACRYNDIMVFNNPAVIQNIKKRGVEVFNIDWTIRNEETVEFMKKYGRSGLPFYILFSPLVPDGMVLPEILDEQTLNQLIDNISLFKTNF